MIVIGLTGSIGMGKTTTAAMFADEGVPVHDSDATVHALYSGRAAPLIEAAFPGTTGNGVVDRTRLAAAVLGNGDALKRLEAIVHPLVREEEERFRSENAAAGADMILLDIPLLFEAG
ncbi:MAG: dephospho-CoA kinase, partial [Alphaproteobacteria bacterium]|nr:dephospho-CoA kinase [Alphaproteobacteria bacterium]